MRVLVAVLLLSGVLVAGLVLLTVAALPLTLALGLTVLTLAGALGTRLRRRPGPWRTARRPDPAGGPEPAHASRLRWTAQWETTPPPEAVPSSRGRLTVVLAEWGLVGEAVEPVLLVVTELLSNAIDHGRGPVRLAVELSDTWLHVEVHDGAPEPPRLRPREPLQARGRGLQMVEALSVRWGWIADPPGKLVWADVRTEWPDSPGAGPTAR